MQEVDGRQVRFHLRVEPDGRGSLIVGASAILRLSASGVVIAQGLLEGAPREALIGRVKAGFPGASPEQIARDVDRICNLVNELGTGRADWPVYNLDDPSATPDACRLMAPIQADVTLAEPDRLRPIFERLWEIGIGHVHLTGGLRPDADWLVRAVERAEDLGLIAGVRLGASALGSGSLLDDLAQAGVDYVTLPFGFADAVRHDRYFGRGDFDAAGRMFAGVARAEVGLVAEVPLIDSTVDEFPEALARFPSLGIENALVYAVAVPPGGHQSDAEALPAKALPQVAELVEEAAGEARVRFVWAAPVACEADRTVESILAAGPRTTAEVSIRVEPDGSVVPARGPHQPAGNLLRDSWETVWSNRVFRRYRERVEAPIRCSVCPGLAVCAVDCPREPAGWSRV
jgi:radical SAM protein with 4Fe4S-binding SPASM domain